MMNCYSSFAYNFEYRPHSVVNADDALVASLTARIPPSCRVVSFGAADGGGGAQADVVWGDVQSVGLGEVGYDIRHR